MKENIIIRSKVDNDDDKLIDIYNSFAEGSVAIYTDEFVGDSLIAELSKTAKVFLVIEINNEVIGFGTIKPYKNFKSFNHTGILTYFIREKHTGLGIGSSLLNKLISDGKELGITNYLAHISSYNNQSLSFHRKHGFEEVGRFKNVFKKFEKSIDIVWVQKEYS